MKAIHTRLQRLESRPRRPSTVATAQASITPAFVGEVLDVLLAIGALDLAAPRSLTIVQDGRVSEVAAGYAR